jgi:predicted metalloendopeptidase
MSPFFNVEADEAVNYGDIGAVIGHEIGRISRLFSFKIAYK